MKLLIVLHHRLDLWSAPDWFIERLQRDFPGLTAVQLRTYDHILDEIADADIAMTWSLHGEQVAAAKKLRWIHSPAAAVHLLMSPELLSRDIIVTNGRAVHGPVVAEHAFALVLAMAKLLPLAAQFQQQRHWGQEEISVHRPLPMELRDSTITIVGLGAIGTPLAELAKAAGMRIIAVREHPERGREVADVVYGFDQIDQALPAADVVVLAAPVTPKTERLMDARRLALLKPDAYLVNVGRGVLIDEPALIAALQQRKFAGAALDVTTEEPLPEDSPLWEMDNVFITPHTAGIARKMWERHYEVFCENLRRFLAGQPLLWTVDKQRGY